ncbi:homing endonuclease associated repeat-containing protein, partial [Halorubrum sp. AJ67]|uniref:homing endonuclease associated repeat-containing protein n=1 Tax=Halorubrum sp. AJ67 TaxID=1173487 RepID=UPI00064E3364
DEDFLDEIRRVAHVADADNAPTLQRFDEHGEIADTTVMRRFGSGVRRLWRRSMTTRTRSHRSASESIGRERRRLGRSLP